MAIANNVLYRNLDARRGIGDLREGGQDRYPNNRQEEVSGALRMWHALLRVRFVTHSMLGLDRWSVRLCDPEAYQARAGEGHLHLRRRGAATDSTANECDLRGAQVRSLSLLLRSPDMRMDTDV